MCVNESDGLNQIQVAPGQKSLGHKYNFGNQEPYLKKNGQINRVTSFLSTVAVLSTSFLSTVVVSDPLNPILKKIWVVTLILGTENEFEIK